MLKNISSKLRSFTTVSNIMRSMSQSKKLTGKVAVVTASTDGIGLAVAKRLAADGASVVISSRKADNVNNAIKILTQDPNLKIIGTPCHVGKAEDREKLLAFAESELGGIDILVSNAAVNPVMGHVLDTPEDAWDKIFDINVKSAFLLTKSTIPYLEKRGGGSVVYISSIAGLNAMNILGAYSVSKTALLGLTKAAATQCAQKKIRVNCVCPGIIKTKFSEVMWSDPSSKKILDEVIPMQRPGEPDEVAGLVSFLCSSDASYITGENFVVAGGYFSRL